MATEINWFTGSGTGFYEKFRVMSTELTFGGAPSDVKEKSLLAYVLSSFTDGKPEVVPVYRLKVTDISDGHHGDVLNLLLLGLGAVASNKEIWLAENLVNAAYDKDENMHGILLKAMLSGLQAAIGALPPIQNDDLALSRQLEINKGEISSLLEKITAARAEKGAE
jgi:hypothetical protein